MREERRREGRKRSDELLTFRFRHVLNEDTRRDLGNSLISSLRLYFFEQLQRISNMTLLTCFSPSRWSIVVRNRGEMSESCPQLRRG